MLGQRVDAVAVPGRPARHRADVHHVGDVARVVTSSVKEVGHGRVRAVEQAKHVELHHPLPLLQRRAGRRAEQHHPGVVDERVETAQFGHGLLNRRGRLLLVGDVGLQHQRGAALLADARGQRFQPVLPPRGQRHGRALGGQRGRRRRADPARRPGHQGDGVIQYGLGVHPASLLVRTTGHPGAARPADPACITLRSARHRKPSHTPFTGPVWAPGPMSYASVRSLHWQLPGSTTSARAAFRRERQRAATGHRGPGRRPRAASCSACLAVRDGQARRPVSSRRTAPTARFRSRRRRC